VIFLGWQFFTGWRKPLRIGHGGYDSPRLRCAGRPSPTAPQRGLSSFLFFSPLYARSEAEGQTGVSLVGGESRGQRSKSDVYLNLKITCGSKMMQQTGAGFI